MRRRSDCCDGEQSFGTTATGTRRLALALRRCTHEPFVGSRISSKRKEADMNIKDHLQMKVLASRPVIPGDYGGGQGPRVSAERFVRARLERDKEEAMRDVDRTLEGNARIKVVGIGGGGSNAVNRMIRSQLRRGEVIRIHTALP